MKILIIKICNWIVFQLSKENKPSKLSDEILEEIEEAKKILRTHQGSIENEII